MNSFLNSDYSTRTLRSPFDGLLLGVDTAELRLRETVTNITDEEYEWEPLPEIEQAADIALSAETKRVWRVYPKDGRFTYDYGDRKPDQAAYTTIAWIMNHIATTADMYLYCIMSGKPAGLERQWSDLTIYPTRAEMTDYLFHVLNDARAHITSLGSAGDLDALNALTPAPWGELRPTYLNLWGGIIEHALQHSMQIAVRKESIRHNF